MSPAKKTLLQAVVLAIVLTAPLLFAQSGVGPAFLPAERKQAVTERPTAEFLKQQIAKQSQGFAGATRSQHAPKTIAPSKEIYATSIILQHGDTHTLLPPFAVIHTPSHLENKITRNPTGKYVPWPQFYNAHRSWLFTYQVTIKQAEGKDPIKPEAKNQFNRINRIVVSIFQHHPISTLPKK
ncbi:MAG: hypothetical protein AB8F34_06730 [Akkermansiaceae bacterium]